MSAYIGLPSLSSELRHYGRLGMKWYRHIFGNDPRWGINRRGARPVEQVTDENFRSSDGSLTPAARELYEKGIAAAKEALARSEESRKERVLEYGIEIGAGDGYDTIKAGITLNRVSSNGNETVDHKRKYVSITDGDGEEYRGLWDSLGIDVFADNLSPCELHYTLTKNAKIAGVDAVRNYIKSATGNMRLGDLSKEIIKSSDPDMLKFISDNSEIKLKSLPYEADFTYDVDKSGMPQKMQKYLSLSSDIKESVEDAALMGYMQEVNIYDHFKNNGYDGVVDVADYTSIADYPVVMLDPKTSMRFKDKEKLF